MFLGIDIGTSSVKAIVTDGVTLVASATAPLTSQSPHPGWSEQDPSTWWNATKSALHELNTLASLSEITAVGLSGQMHGAVLLDKDHTVLRPAILWNDSRSTAACAQLRASLPGIGEIAGVLPLPGFTAPKLMWVRDHEPDVHAQIAHVLLPKDYVGLRLHGSLATDRSDAAGTLWLDQAARDWSAIVASESATDTAWLPQLFDGHEVVGTVTETAANETGIPRGIPVVAGGGDAATGAVSLGATEAGRGFISLGTSGQLFVAGDAYSPNPAKFVHAFAHTVPDRWYQMAAMLNGARPIAWLADQLGIAEAEVVALAETADPARAPIFLPYLTGERSPHGDPNIRAGFFGLEDATDRAGLCRAVVEAISFTFADAAESFGDTINDLPHLAAIGGGSKSPFLLQLIANATGKRIGRAAGSDAGPALGAARLAACGTGALALSDLGATPAISDWFDPERSDLTTTRLARYRALYRALQPLA
ncbi:xylulokinase [Marivita hallyeonensis]|uniref:Xylulose kinase n=1 Tax=Marivita hallyeonensis TaxID=996342 RepID=A0A1M5WF97_9RHOB|nr:xylulokinase [Marivita hallyeonensis]SHH86130.1 xylulokinase [Marivita hallyeonensis]